MAKFDLAFAVGGLLYMPASNTGIVGKIKNGAIPHLSAISFCLEDSIEDDFLQEAEVSLAETLGLLEGLKREGAALPLVFVRIRNPHHLRDFYARFASSLGMVTGFILPKFDLHNADDYIDAIRWVSVKNDRFYFMPILESWQIASFLTRQQTLAALKEKIDSVEDKILNIRVGANDFSNLFGVRREPGYTIYDLRLVSDVLMDILNVFSRDYVVSGPIHDNFEIPNETFLKEVRLDIMNGFFGKTLIHPNQVALYHEGIKVSRADFLDATRILNWKKDDLGVEKSASGSRMNERKCNVEWARRILAYAKLFGENEND